MYHCLLIMPIMYCTAFHRWGKLLCAAQQLTVMMQSDGDKISIYCSPQSKVCIMCCMRRSERGSDFGHGPSVVVTICISKPIWGLPRCVFGSLLCCHFVFLFWFGFLVVDCLCISSCSRSHSRSVLVLVCDTRF